MSNEKGLPSYLRARSLRGLPEGVDRENPWVPFMGNAIFLSRNFKVDKFSVGTVPIRVLAPSYTWAFVFVNEGSPIIYLGSNRHVSWPTGFPLFAGDKDPFIVEENSEIWAIVQQGTGSLTILEI